MTITPLTPGNQRDDRRSRSRFYVRLHLRDRSASRLKHPSTDRHTSRYRNPRQRHMPERNRAQSWSPHRQWSSSNRPPTPYARHNSRSRSSSRSNEKLHRRSVNIQDNPEDQYYNSPDDFFDEDLN